MDKIRILVVDDAVVIRKLVSALLNEDPEIEVVGTASNGQLALAQVEYLKPELITLDVEMPEMDGLQALAALRKIHARLPVIMFSTLTQSGARATLDALSLGANDYVTKPGNVGSMSQAIQRIRAELVPKIKALCRRRSSPSALPPRPPPPRLLPTAAPIRPAVVEVVVIAVSTGGPNALAKVLPALPETLPVPVVIVQHMPPVFTHLLAERLNAQSALGVREARAGERLEPGLAWLAPGDQHLIVARQGTRVLLQLHQGPPENSCRPSADVLFRSAAEIFGAGVLGVVLTGMGKDGLRGCETIREAGGRIIVQDEATSVVWGMPGFVAEAGLAEQVLPLDRIAAEIVQRVRRGNTFIRPAQQLTSPRGEPKSLRSPTIFSNGALPSPTQQERS